MKSNDVLDVTRLRVTDADVIREMTGESIEVRVTFRYDTWEPSPAQDVIWEQINALQCVRALLVRGGIRPDDE